MKQKRFTEEQMIVVLHEAAASENAPEVCRKHSITKMTFHRCQEKYGGLQISAARRLEALEEKNRGLKQLVAVLSVDDAVLKDVVEREW